MSEQKPRKFRALKNLTEDFFPSDYRVKKGEILTLLKAHEIQFSAIERPRNDSVMHNHWFYLFTDFEEVFENESNINIVRIEENKLPKHCTKVSIDDLIKLRSAFSLDEIIVMIEKGIV